MTAATTAPSIDVVAIGNAIVDIIGRCDDAFLARHKLAKGSMQLADWDAVARLYQDMGPGIEISGGSAANTMVGVASFGGKAAFVGKVADDDFGRIFAHDIAAAGVTFATKPAGNASAPTARSLVLVTPDGERTMNTFLGVSPELDHGEVLPELIASAKIVYLEGYLFDRPAAKAAFRQSAAVASKAGRKVALSLSDAFCVDRHRHEFRELIRDEVDILFANEAEIKSLYQVEDFEAAAAHIARDSVLAVLTRGAKGSVVLSGGKSIAIHPEMVAEVVDTTGAGDLYAAGFLYGLAHGHDHEVCGRLASLAAAEIITHLGARPATSLKQIALHKGIKI